MLPIIRHKELFPIRCRNPWHSLDRFMNDLLPIEFTKPESFQNIGNLDLYEDDKNVYLDVELPGFARDQIELTIEDGVLHMQAKQSEKTEEKEDEKYYVRERSLGTWTRSVQLPVLVQEENVEAHFKDGILKVTLEKQDQKLIHKIEVT